MQESYTYVERIDKVRAEYIFSLTGKQLVNKFGDKKNKKDWEENVIPQLHKTIRKHHNANFEPVSVKYMNSKNDQKNSIKGGRYYAEAHAIMYMPKTIRNFLVNDFYKDYDISNCHPSLLSYAAEKYELGPMPYLNSYVSHRSNFMATNNTTKEEMHVFMHTDKENQKNLRKKSIGVKALLDEVDRIQNHMWKNLSQSYPSEMFNDKKNPLSSLMTILMNHEETKISNAMISQTASEEVIWMFDGAMFPVDCNVDKNPMRNIDASLDKWVCIVEKPMESNVCVPIDFKGYDIASGKMRHDQLNAYMILQEMDEMLYKTRNELYMYCEDDGLWSTDEEEHYRTLCKHKVIGTELLDNGGNVETPFHQLLRGAYKLMRSMATKIDSFTVEPSIGFLLFNNGVLDMKNNEILKYDAKFHFTRKIYRDYVTGIDRSGLEDEIVNRLLRNPIPDDQKVNYLLQLISRGVAGRYMDRIGVTQVGDSACGKGKFRDLMKTAFGEYVGEFMTDHLLYKKGNEKESDEKMKWLIPISDCRVIFGSEIKKMPQQYGPPRLIDGEMYKRLISGGDKIDCRALYKNSVQKDLMALIVFMANDVPNFFPADDAVQHRHRLIQYTRKSKKVVETDDFYFPADSSIDNWVKDPIIGDALVSLVVKRYQQSLKSPLEAPEIVQRETQEYTGATDEPLQWVLDNFEIVEKTQRAETFNSWKNETHQFDFEKIGRYYMVQSDLYDEFESAVGGMSKQKFSRELEKLELPMAMRKISGKPCTVRLGIRRHIIVHDEDSTP